MQDYKDSKLWLMQGDCLERMREIPDASVDMVLCDPPYGTTACKWDSVIDLDKMWLELKRVTKSNGAIVLFGSEPFSSALRMSNLKDYKYDWVWKKNTSAGFVHAKNMPMKRHENIIVFSTGSMGHLSLLKEKRMLYNPQNLKEVSKIHKSKKTGMVNIIGKRPSHKTEFKVEYEGYPLSILEFSKSNAKSLHPTQKPIELIEYLIKTYTNEGMTVLDFTMGSGTTGVGCVNLNRNFIGIELDTVNNQYFDIAKNRILTAKE